MATIDDLITESQIRANGNGYGATDLDDSYSTISGRDSLSSRADSLFQDALSPDLEGWLEKKGNVVKNWKKRWFVLKNNELKYYKKPKDKTPKGAIDLEGVSVQYVPVEAHNKKYCFEIRSPKTERVFVLVAETGTNMQSWLNEIQRAMLRIRREKSKRQAADRVEQLLLQQEQEAIRRLTGDKNDPTTHQPASPAHQPLASPPRSPAPPMVASPTDADPDDEKQLKYMQWLSETQTHQRRGTVADRESGRETGPHYMEEPLLPQDPNDPSHYPYTLQDDSPHAQQQQQEQVNGKCLPCCSIM